MTDALNHYRLLGASGLRISPLTLGAMIFGAQGEWGTDRDAASAMLDYYIERGGNSIDTANFYAMGESERILGELIADRRQRLILATKYSLTMRPGDANASGNHRKNMVQSVEDSLKRLRTDYIDLFYLHVWDSHTPVEEILRAFDDLVRAGKLLYVGISDTPAWQVSRMQAIAALRGWAPLVALQISYSLAERTVERELMPMAREMGLGVLPWSPLAGGVLSGKYSANDLDKETAAGAQSRHALNLATGRLNARALAIADEVSAVAREIGCTPSQVALAWTLLNPAVASTIVGARTPQQLADNLAALDIALDGAQRARLDAVSAVEPCFPHTMLSGERARMMFGGVTVKRRPPGQ